MLLILVIILVLVAIGALPTWPYATGFHYGYYPSGLLVLVIIVLILVVLSGRGV